MLSIEEVFTGWELDVAQGSRSVANCGDDFVVFCIKG